MIQPEALVDLATILQDVLSRLNVGLNNPAYNYIIHTSPLGDLESGSFHWHIEIMPKLLRVAGFEWGSGFYINPVFPEDAAVFLKHQVK